MPSQMSRGVAAKPPAEPGRAECRDDPDAFMPVAYTAKAVAAAKGICRRCPIRRECAAWVAGHPQDDGIYAAMTPKERRGLGDLVAAAGGDVGRVLRLFDDREALGVAMRPWGHAVSRSSAVTAVGEAQLERARLVSRHAPELVGRVLAGEVSLREAAVTAQAVADRVLEAAA